MSTETLSVISRSLDVIRSMAGINQKNVAELATIMGTSTRNVYYLINELKTMVLWCITAMASTASMPILRSSRKSRNR